MDIRNIAIIAHVDHGKTTLVDGMLKQTHAFRENQAEMQQTTILDSNELERERGITILAKNTAVEYKGVKINIIDTPGHADFGGEVERVLNMADAALLIVDAAEGPLPQTKFVLQKALETGLKVILVINKIDKRDARAEEVLHETEELFLRLAKSDADLEFPVIYAVGREGKAFEKLPQPYDSEVPGDLTPLFEMILKEVPNAVTQIDQPAQMLVSTLDFDNHLGKLGIGRVKRGVLRVGQRVKQVTPEGEIGAFNVDKLYTSKGIAREEIKEANSGDIVAVAGVPEIEIGQTICDAGTPEALPVISVEEPTLKITIGANTSPFAGREGKFVNSRQLGERLKKEKETNLGMRFGENGSSFVVAGRGELHLAVLLETLRRESYEMEVSRPQVIMKEDAQGKLTEPYEEITIDVPDEYVGAVTAEMGQRKAEMIDLQADGKGSTRMVYQISQRNSLGARNQLLSQTRGTVVWNSLALGYREAVSVQEVMRNGVLVATDPGKASSYALENAWERGSLFVDPGEEVYEGMVVGVTNKDQDIEINVVKEKMKTNMRQSVKDIKPPIPPAVKMSLEQLLDFLADDELLEVTPNNLRLRKKKLGKLERVRWERQQRSQSV